VRAAAEPDEYINSDDCWMVSCRNPAEINKTCHKAVGCCGDFKGPQIPDPVKFPGGIPPVVDYIHGKGLKAGLYTSASPWTCAGFAASCQFEDIDAKQWAEWNVDYMKEDACGQCRSGGKIDDYKAMQDAIDATGAPLILTIEGNPPFPETADGAHGNARRVGHDISPAWISMTSLVDIGSGLWSFAHNDTGKGGWWNECAHFLGCLFSALICCSCCVHRGLTCCCE
jgi:alpha-galactosidase